MSASIVKRAEHRYSVVVEEGSQPARRCVAGCKGGRVWANDHPDVEACPRCRGPLGPVALERRQRWHGPYKRLKDAEAAKAQLNVAREQGTYAPPARLTVHEFLIEGTPQRPSWLSAIEGTVRPSTFRSYSDNLTNHVVPRIGHLMLRDLGPEHLNAMYGELARSGRRNGKGGLGARTIAYIHKTLNRALRDAVRWRLIVRNPATDADPPKPAEKPMRYWTPEQLRAFIEYAPEDRLQAGWVLFATSGLRRGELLGLRWSDLDLEAGRLSVQQTLIAVGYEVRFSEPKTERGRRSMTLDPVTVGALRAWKARQNEERLAVGEGWRDQHGLAFTRPDGSPIHPQTLSYLFEKRVQRAGLPMIRLHDVRHSFASAALAAGEHPKVVQERLGHSTTTVTLDTYSHVSREVEEAAAHRIAARILGS